MEKKEEVGRGMRSSEDKEAEGREKKKDEIEK